MQSANHVRVGLEPSVMDCETLLGFVLLAACLKSITIVQSGGSSLSSTNVKVGNWIKFVRNLIKFVQISIARCKNNS